MERASRPHLRDRASRPHSWDRGHPARMHRTDIAVRGFAAIRAERLRLSVSPLKNNYGGYASDLSPLR